jgi:hypothetical protein
LSLRDHAYLVASAGIDIRPLTPLEVYMLAGRILQDEPLRQVVVMSGNILKPGTRVKVLRSWPESERAKLRERVLGVIQMERKTS